MALNWMKWMKGLGRRREVLAIGHALSRGRREIASACMEVWEWADDNSRNGKISGVGISHVDAVAEIPGFATAMIDVGWLKQTETGIEFPRWNRHNTKTGKQRALAAARQRKKRHADVTLASRKCHARASEQTTELETEVNGSFVRSFGGKLEGGVGGNQKADEFEFACLGYIEEKHLGDPAALCAFHRLANAEQPRAVSNDEPGILRIIAFGLHSLRHGKRSKVGMFGWMLRNPSRAKLSGDDRSRARAALKAHRESIARGEIKSPDAIPLCDIEEIPAA